MADKKIDEEKVKKAENEVKIQESSETTIDANLKDIIKRVQKESKISKEEIEKLKKEALDSVNFVEKIEQISLDFDKYVIFTDGNDQLIYEDGEFYVVSTTDISQKKEKKKKEEAKNMYLEYFITYVLNPIIKQKDLNEQAKVVSSPTIERETEEIKKKIAQKSQEKKVEERIPEKEIVKPKTKEKVEIEIDDIDI